jgi:hypothetical protein
VNPYEFAIFAKTDKFINLECATPIAKVNPFQKGDNMKCSSVFLRRSMVFIFAVVALLGVAFFPRTSMGQTSYDMPTTIDPNARYFLFMHNYYVEKNGPLGDCKYNEILASFVERGFVVISEVRTGKIIPCTYAEKVVRKVKTLLDSGVPPQNITVGGHSKGGVISLCVASALDNSKVNFVVMAGCEIASVKKYEMYPDFNKLKGRILSIYAASDTIAGSCKEAFSMATKELVKTEITLENDAGHKLFFVPGDIWLEPIIKWINEGQKR